MNAEDTSLSVQDRLRAPFAADDVEFKPAVVAKDGNRALALGYADARCYMDRLDLVLGVAGWQTSFEVVGTHSVKLRLLCKIDDEWVGKEDVGSFSDQPDPGDKMKAAVSDGIKRAAVQFGVGRYLYNLPQIWADYDPQKRQFTKPPTLPAWALPTNVSKKGQAQKLLAIKEETRQAIAEKCRDGNYRLSQVLEAVGCTPFKQLSDATEEAGQKILAYLDQLSQKAPV